MKHRIIRKLRSRTGASILFALLLFLVCAVLCSVVLAASTAASGRMSRIAGTDQKYYAVTSAAELLKDLIDGKSVSIVKVTETTYRTNYSNAGGMIGAPTTIASDTKTYLVADKKAAEITGGELDASKLAESAPIDTIPMDAAKNMNSENVLNGRELTLGSDFSSAGLDYDVLAVTILEDLDKDGSLTLTLYNKYQAKDVLSGPGSRYSLQMVFGADKAHAANANTEVLSRTALPEDAYSEETIVTETDVTSLTWALLEIKTGG